MAKRQRRPQEVAHGSLEVLKDVAYKGWAETLRLSVLMLVLDHPGKCLSTIAGLIAWGGTHQW